MSLAGKGVLPITDSKMTRFMITLEDAVELVWQAFDDIVGGEIYIKKIPSMKVTDIAKAISPKSKLKVIGIRPGEKLHEQMIGPEDAEFTYDYDGYYKILPSINRWGGDRVRIGKGVKVNNEFHYTSDNNLEWMSIQDLKEWIEVNHQKIEIN